MSENRPSPGRSGANRDNKDLPAMPVVKKPPPKSILFSSILDEDASVPIPMPVPVPDPVREPSEEGELRLPICDFLCFMALLILDCKALT